MRAAYIEAFGETDVLKVGELPLPEPGPGEVRVRLVAAGVNHLDVWIRKGVANPKITFPHVLGADGAGVVDAVGPGADDTLLGKAVVLNPGVSCGRCEACLSGADNLCPGYQILGEHRHGSYAEYVIVPQTNVAPKPKALSFEEAASFPLTFLTAWQMVVDKLRVSPGETLLVMAAGSGVGVAALQIGKLFGARVIAAAGSDEKLARAQALGADEVVNYNEPGWYKVVRKLTGGQGVDAVADHTGRDYWESVIKATRNGGRIALVGATSGYQATTPLGHVFYRQLTIYGSTMASKSRLFRILRLIEAGKLRPVVADVLPLAEVREAHRRLEGRSVFGKIILRVS